MHERVMLTAQRPDSHESSYARLPFRSRATQGLLFNSRVAIDYECWPREIIPIFIGYEVISVCLCAGFQLCVETRVPECSLQTP